MTTREVVLDGGSPWGFRMHGGVDVNQPLRVSRVNPGSKAAIRGIREGDLITSINGQPTKELSNADAHNLLKNAGDLIKLGLNEDCDGSPKRRLYKTVHQETHSETIKKSSTSSYTLTSSKTTQSHTETNNEISTATKLNNNERSTKVNDDIRNEKHPRVISQRSTLSSVGSSNSSIDPTAAEGADVGSASLSDQQRSPIIADSPNTLNEIMADNAVSTTSRSRRKRSRNRRKKNKIAGELAETATTSTGKQENYRVDSPETVKKDKQNNNNNKQSVKKLSTSNKSKSLDDDEMVKIQELSEVSESEDKTECNQAVVSEAESDVEWEMANDLEMSETCNLSTLSLPLIEHVTEQVTLISPEEELTLRNFLEGLNLVNSPEDTAKQTEDSQSTVESMKVRKAKKRAALEQYFTPIAHNPRFLDVISEETSDLSDKEQPIGHHLKQGTPEPVEKSPVLTRKELKLQRKMQSHYCAPISKTILVDTKIIDTPVMTQGVISSSEVEKMSQAEVVFLEENTSSETSTSSRNSVNSDSNLESEENTDKESATNSETISQKREISVTVRKNDLVISQTNIQSEENLINELTPPPTPDNISPKNESILQLVSEKIVSSVDKNNEIVNDLLSDNNKSDCQTPDDSNEASSIVYSDAVSPPVPSRSPSTASSSESSKVSLCTAKYNPMNSSIADIMSISKDDEELLRKYFQPPTLRVLCLNYLISLPFGADVLQELADVSLSIESFTSNFPNKIPKLPAFIRKEIAATDANNETSFDLPVSPNNQMRSKENWAYLASDENLRLLMGLSPTQKTQLEKSRKTEDEAAKLLDLHDKFLTRRAQNTESASLTMPKQVNKIEITSIKQPIMSNRLLAMFRNEPPNTTKTPPQRRQSYNPQDYLYYEETDKLNTLPQRTNQRLNAKNLNEWLQLARNKSTSESSLPNIAAEDSTNSRARAGINALRFTQRRTSLPQEFYERQMQYLLEKEREIQRELEHLEDEKRKLSSEMAPSRQFQPDDYRISRKGDYAENKSKSRPISMPSVSTEVFRQQMYEEYMNQVADREERKQLKVIKIKNVDQEDGLNKNKISSGIEDEFMDKVKEKQKLGKLNLKSGDSEGVDRGENEKIDEDDTEPVLVMDGDSLKGTRNLPKHLQEFVDLTKYASEINLASPSEDGMITPAPTFKATAPTPSVWSPGQKQEFHFQENAPRNLANKNEPISPVWTPRSAASSPTTERKEFKPVKFESPVLGRKNLSRTESTESASAEPPWKVPETSSDTGVVLSSSLQKRIPTSHSSPASGFNDFSSHRLPRAQNPTITLLQKAREGQLPRGASYIDQNTNQFRRPKNDKPPILGPGEFLYQVKNEYTSESDSERPRKMADLGSRKFDGIGPTTKDGMPLILRSEVKDANQSKWYKRMYDTIHKQRPHRDEYVTVRYKQRRGQYPYTSGYLSEPEPGAYDSDFTDYKYATLDRRRVPVNDKENDYATSSTMPKSATNKSSSSSDIIKHTQDYYKNQPGRIENYQPGHSSISEKEAKEWWDEVMDIFDGWMDDNSALPSYDYMFSRALAKSHLEQQKRVPQPHQRSFINQALKESGYESDSTLVFRRRDEAAQQLSPQEQKEAYKVIQKGGDVPLQGLRKPAPERPKDAVLEYFPISPTLTRIRIHKKIIPQKEIICYPVTVHPHPSTVFANYKRTAPSASSTIPKPPPMPPSPPRRRSSRNNSTLRLISTMKVKTDKSPSCKRHETCFTTTSNIDNTKVKYLRDKITCKLSPVSKKKSDAKPKLRVSKVVTTSPDVKSKIVSTITTTKDPLTSSSRIQSKTNIARNIPERCPARTLVTNRKIKKKSTVVDEAKTFGSEKRRVDLILPKDKSYKLVNSPDLLSPNEVKKAVQTQKTTPPSGTVYKKSNAVLCSSKNTIPIRVGITEKGKTILKSKSCSPTSLTRRDKSSQESLRSPVTTRKIVSTIGTLKPMKSKSTNDLTNKKLKKSKKEEINGQIAKLKTGKTNEKTKCAGRAAGNEIVKKLRDMEDSEFGSSSTLADIQRQKEAVQTDYFFQHLFLRDIPSPTFSTCSRNSWLLEKTYQLQNRKSSVSEPSIGAMKVYLKHTKPVTDSKFKSLDFVRSRSASPKSVTWELDKPSKPEKRSISLPPKLVFSQTSRPVSPKIYHRPTPPQSPETVRSRYHTLNTASCSSRALIKPIYCPPAPPSPTQYIRSSSARKIMRSASERIKSPVEMGFYPSASQSTPPPSPRAIRSPSSRRIMRSVQERSKSPEGSIYVCPSLAQSTSSIDSCDHKDYQNYIKELLYSSRRSSRFKELNDFYSTIEKFGQLEQTASSIDLKPRRKFEDEIIDYDRWREVRVREKAEKELRSLYLQLKQNEKEKGFLFFPKEVDKYRWKRELDRGLRTKEKSVDNIKEEFERLKLEESERENAKRREIAYSKDTYKPLWRGDSVINLANRMVERRSQSEGRVAAARQKFLDSERILTHGIGSRLWSSLSMEQVNLLKSQLSEIYGQNLQKKNEIDYSIQVPPEKIYYQPPTLTIRRNSDSLNYYKDEGMSEENKKMLSQTLSREVIDRMSKRNCMALPLVLAKETRGAIAAAEANLKPVETTSLETTEEEKNPVTALVTTDALTPNKLPSASETESGSTDESSKTVVYVDKNDSIKKKVEYFENVLESDRYSPTIYKPFEEEEESAAPSIAKSSVTSQSYQDLKELFGEQELVKFATVPLSATRKQVYVSPERPQLRAVSLSPLRTSISEATSNDSLYRSRSLSPYIEEPLTLVKVGEVQRLKDKFDSPKPRRSRSDTNLYRYGQISIPGQNFGDVDLLRSRYEYPAYSGRGRSRIRRGGVVSPVFLRAEDRFMPHINIISKISDLYARKSTKEKSRSNEELAQILGCPVGEVEKMRKKFDSNISLLGHMFTSSPNIRELRDIAPYLAASWMAHRYPRSEDNTRLLSSPDNSIASRDTALVKRNRAKSISPTRPKKSSILKHQRHHSADCVVNKKIDPKTQPVSRYQPEPVRYRSWWTPTYSRPSVSFKEPEPPVPPPKGQHGIRNLDPESPRKYVENEVTIHYKTPVRQEIKEYLSEDELAHRQAEAMKKIYQEERRRKYLQVSKSLQELQDMNNRRHTDNFIPSQKSPISLNRYDDFDDLSAPSIKPRPRSPEPRLMARALYNFIGQTARELTFRKGDLIYVRRQVDKNWYEGELNAMVGLFPVNYVEIVNYDSTNKSTPPRKSHEGQARAKYNFVAQTHLELSLGKGELVTITRKVDDNWYEGKIGGRKGIFPVSYVDVLIDPNDPPPPSSKPVASPAAHSMLLNGSAGGKESMGSHSYIPNLPSQQLSSSYHAKPVQITSGGNYGSLNRSVKNPVNQTLHIETQSEPVPYRVLYKYLPQNDDELELLEGDTVYVLEKCDDGWYVGSSDRTGAFGTFPGNYVEKI